MMSGILKVVLLLALAVGSSLGAARLEIAEINPAFPGKCWIADRNEAYAPGRSWQLKDVCGKEECQESNGKLYHYTESCGVIAVPPSCKSVADKSKPYPDCCPKSNCK